MVVLKWLRDAWIIIGLTLLLVILVDAAVKGRAGADAWPRVVAGAEAPDRKSADFYRDAPALLAYWQEHGAARAMAWEPYVYWRRKARSGNLINIAADGTRRTWQPPTANWTIWVAGGSAVWGTGVGDDDTVPSWVARLLAEAGMPARVVNLGESGYVTGQSLAFVQSRLRETEAPELVVFLEGANDVFSALQAGRPGVPQNEANRARDFRATDGVEHYLAAFPRALEGLRGLVSVGEPLTERSLVDLAIGVVDHYRQNRRQARAVLHAYGADAVHIWQPTVFSKAQPSVFEEQVVAAAYRDHESLQLACDRLVVEADADSDGQRVLSDVFAASRETVFMDPLHLGPDGNRAVAAALLPYLIEWHALQVHAESLAD